LREKWFSTELFVVNISPCGVQLLLGVFRRHGENDMSETAQPGEQVIALLKSFKERKGSDYRLISLGIFGSLARDEARNDSDVDIFFETDEPNLFRTSSMRAELEDLLGRRVDVVRLRERMNPRLKQRILKESEYV
jgi:uncharacterized protein